MKFERLTNFQRIQLLKNWIWENTPNHVGGVLIPNSGGTDSALTWWLYNQVYSKDIFPGKVKGLYVGKKIRCEEWYQSNGYIELVEPYISDPSIDPEVVRWAMFLHYCLEHDRVLIGTRNRTEHVLGIYSHASRLSMHLPLANVWKSEVIELCKYVGVPQEIIDSSTKPDLACGRNKTMAAISFEELDNYLRDYLGNKTAYCLEAFEVDYINALLNKGSYKQDLELVGPKLY